MSIMTLSSESKSFKLNYFAILLNITRPNKKFSSTWYIPNQLFSSYDQQNCWCFITSSLKKAQSVIFFPITLSSIGPISYFNSDSFKIAYKKRWLRKGSILSATWDWGYKNYRMKTSKSKRPGPNIQKVEITSKKSCTTRAFLTSRILSGQSLSIGIIMIH